ncbi:MAG TPA: hypothetical protein DDW52_28985 [Planctomycetaceae bacterium]|nr:hypothetical protein [Planctomycetaceae bacterium]
MQSALVLLSTLFVMGLGASYAPAQQPSSGPQSDQLAKTEQAPSAGALYDQLLEKGIGPIGERYYPIASPSVAGKSEDERLAAAQEVSGRIGWKRFSKDSIFAPVAINIESIKNDAGQKVAHRIHCAFVVYGQLEELKNQELLENILLASTKEDNTESQAGSSDDPDGQELSQQQLRAAGVDPESETETFAKIGFALFNRVKVSGVIRADRVELADAVGAAWQFDSRFVGELAGQWRRLSKNNLGAPVVGEPNNYTGCGGLMLVQTIDSERLLVESMMVMHEPPEWFNGSQFLRSKLPSGMQENARSFRRKLEQSRK